MFSTNTIDIQLSKRTPLLCFDLVDSTLLAEGDYYRVMCGRAKDPWQDQVIVDGVDVEVPEDAEGVLIANIGSYMGGVDLWQNENQSNDNIDPQSMHDKRLEVVSIVLGTSESFRTLADPWQEQVIVDGVAVEVPEDAEDVLIANIGSYMGGVDLWQNENQSNDNFDPQSMHDKRLEVVSIVVHVVGNDGTRLDIPDDPSWES
ncbi:diacylglycerol kinase 1 [Artemisia annua]|uniref:Diacylglycerol kinase 1 n=1 Tax=Artemisia annua TaxID=35608 RepID=A0A2U1PDS8_ARTAN|nr:diacylglycerol kinase 1 [Artemisia annua]